MSSAHKHIMRSIPTMVRRAANFLLLIVAAATCTISLVTCAPQQPQLADHVGASCIPHEREALLAFKEGITSDPTGMLDSWTRQGGHYEQDCCQWRGVHCSNHTGHVLKLRLRNENVDGVVMVPADNTSLVGQISHSLLSLEHLKHLDLSYNDDLGGSTSIPEFLGSLKNLKYLNLSGIDFFGNIPPQLGNLSKLQYLDLSESLVEYIINSTNVSWLTRLPLLEHLDLSWVDLSTVADWPQVLNMIPSLRVIRLTGCLLTSANQSLPNLNLTNLQELQLSENYFDHPISSGWFWNLTSLKYLNLGFNSMYGRVPDALGDMTSLQVLDISNCAIMMPYLKNLCSLEILYLGSSHLHGDATELFKSMPRCSPSKLQELYLYDNNITGPFPAPMWNLTSLRILDLSSNYLSGRVPEEISVLTNLTYLILRNNKLDGVITEDHFGSLKSLRLIDLSSNSLKIEINSKCQPPFRLHYARFASCQMGPLFPAWLQWQVDISFLDISNVGINDRIPHWFSNAFKNARYLNISNNQLNGVLPANMEIMSVKELYLSSNQLTGQIPPFPRNLTYLDMSRNSLSGPLPPADFGAPKLKMLSLFSNHFTGRVSESICKYERLETLDLANNHFEGELPVCLGNNVITFLVLSNNSFSGKFPSFVKNFTQLEVLDLAGNMFSGRLPAWIGSLVGLRFLRLSHNKFIGNIPINITSLKCLQFLDIASNRLSGSLPMQLSNLIALRQKYSFCGYDIIFDDSNSFFAVTKGQQLNFGSIERIINMTIIDFSSNYLTGEIPEEIATVDALMSLNLSRNQFSGNIPSNIGAIQSLESLDFSRNKLSGEIPTSLTGLTFLSYFDLSYNNLTGRIPPGTQLETIYDENQSIYTGNIGLCGPPLKKNCSSSDASRQGHPRTTKKGYVVDIFYLGLGCGFILGIWVVFCALLLKKQWRVAYFRLFDYLYDKAYVLVIVIWARLTTKSAAN